MHFPLLCFIGVTFTNGRKDSPPTKTLPLCLLWWSGGKWTCTISEVCLYCLPGVVKDLVAGHSNSSPVQANCKFSDFPKMMLEHRFSIITGKFSIITDSTMFPPAWFFSPNLAKPLWRFLDECYKVWLMLILGCRVILRRFSMWKNIQRDKVEAFKISLSSVSTHLIKAKNLRSWSEIPLPKILWNIAFWYILRNHQEELHQQTLETSAPIENCIFFALVQA